LGGLIAQEEAELFAVDCGGIASLKEVFLQVDGTLGESVVLDEGVDETVFGGSPRLVFGPGDLDQAVEVCAVFPSEDGEGAGESVGAAVLGDGGLSGDLGFIFGFADLALGGAT
jgi:hypothetical protein